MNIHKRLKQSFRPAGIFKPAGYPGALELSPIQTKLSPDSRTHRRQGRIRVHPAAAGTWFFLQATCPHLPDSRRRILAGRAAGGAALAHQEILEGAKVWPEHQTALEPLPDWPQVRADGVRAVCGTENRGP